MLKLTENQSQKNWYILVSVRLRGGIGVMLIIKFTGTYQSKGQMGEIVKYTPMCLDAPFPECAG